MKYCLGIDFGGTGIKIGVVSEEGKILAKKSIPTDINAPFSKVVADIGNLCREVVSLSGLRMEDVSGVGMGYPGMTDSKNGLIIYASNVPWRNVQFRDELKKHIPFDVVMSNDANVAALAEATYGGEKKFDNAVLLTLGTGVGGGVIIDGKILEGNGGAGAELGHTVIRSGGEPCNCGRKGCLEAYASATALIRDTKRAIQAHPDSMMYSEVSGDLDKVSGITAFKCAKLGDEYAKAVVDSYVNMLSEGVIDFINIFRPDVVMIGGGVSAEGEYLIGPIRERVKAVAYAPGYAPDVEIRTATLGNDAGIIGAAALAM